MVREFGGTIEQLWLFFFFSSRRRHTRLTCDWSSDVCSSDLTAWVSASLHTQPLEVPAIRDLIRVRLALPGVAQMLLEFGPAHSGMASPRRPVPDLLV